MMPQRGFTLIEMAIVLVIITILIGGLAMPLAAQIQARRYAETKKILEEAHYAIIGYAMSHPSTTNPDKPYLPCPDTNGDGLEDRAGDTCAQADGWLPWTDLGTASQDAWGNRLHYSVETHEYADKSKGLPNFSLYSPPYLTLNLKRICRSSACTQVDAIYLPVVVFSHGPNGRGALNINGNTLSNPSSTDELENTNGDANFVSRTPTRAGDASGEFDDLVTWISDGQLRSRVCPAGGCP
jgi:prepilin-type N-terminal cleavage/methylation domain-containing protein